MSTRRKVFKAALCLNCANFVHVKFQDGTVLTMCDYGRNHINLSLDNLAQECSGYLDKLKDKHWELFNKATTEIPIIGQKKVAKAGFQFGDTKS